LLLSKEQHGFQMISPIIIWANNDDKF
jgi:hypothetical protein